MKKKREEKPTYEVRLQCRNCDNEWVIDVDKGTYVRYEKDNIYMIKAGESEKKKKFFQCPKCGANKKIGRLPLV